MDSIKAIEDIVKKWIFGETAKTGATVEGVGARTAAEQTGASAGLIVNFEAMIKSITASAATTFAGIFSFLSPVMGPAAVGPAVAGESLVLGAVSAIPSLAIGSWALPSDGPILAHKGEMVVPAFQSGQFREALDRLGQGDGDSGGERRGGDMHNHFHGAILDGEKLAKIISAAFNKNPSLRPIY